MLWVPSGNHNSRWRRNDIYLTILGKDLCAWVTVCANFTKLLIGVHGLSNLFVDMSGQNRGSS